MKFTYLKGTTVIVCILLVNFMNLGYSLQPQSPGDLESIYFDILRGFGVTFYKTKIHHPIPRLSDNSFDDQDLGKTGIQARIQSPYSIPGWADTRWQFRKNITIDSSKVSADLTNFPVLIELFDADLQKDAQASGNDIIFTNASGFILDYEIESYQRLYNSSHAKLVAWVKVPYLSSSQNTIISLYYGHPTIGSQENPSEVWSDDYKGVWHLPEDPAGSAPQMKDSTLNNNHGTTFNLALDDQIAGQIDGSIDFDNVQDYVDCGNDSSLNTGTGDLSLSLWFNYDAGSMGPIAGKGAILGGIRYYITISVPSGYIMGQIDDNTVAKSITTVSPYGDNMWHHAVLVRDGNLLRLYIDGSEEANSPLDITGYGSLDNIHSFYMNTLPSDNSGTLSTWSTVKLDEVRVSNVAKSLAWIETEFNNQYNPYSFYSVSSKESHISDDWALKLFRFRKAIVINSSKVTADLTNFPVLIELFDKDLHNINKIQEDGDDIIFTDSNGKKLEHEIEVFEQDYNLTHAHLVVWVKIPNLSSTINTKIIMYYGNEAISSQVTPSDVWDNNYVGIWHLNQDPASIAPQINDSTSPASHGTTFGSMSSSNLIEGKIGESINFDGINDYINIGNPTELQITGAITIESWIRADFVGNDYAIAKMGLGGQRGWDISFDDDVGISPDGWMMFRYSVDGTAVKSVGYERINSSSWYHVVGVYNPSTYARFYVNGQLVDEDTISIPSSQYDPSIPVRFAVRADNTGFYNGTLDEIRISNIVRSSEWIATEYLNQLEPRNFYSVSDEEINLKWWVDRSFNYRKDFIIDHNQVPADLIDFPLLIRLTDNSFKTGKVQSDGSDFMFVDVNGTKLNHEIESFSQNSTHGELVAWVKLPFLKSTEDTLISLYYGNSELSDQENPALVWDSYYRGVWHLNNDPTGSIIDSTLNNFDGVSGGSMSLSDLVTAKIGEGIDFDGSNDRIVFPDPYNTETMTFSSWIYLKSNIDTWITVAMRSDGITWFDWQFYARADDAQVLRYRAVFRTAFPDTSEVGSNIILSTGTWYYLSADHNGTHNRFFLDGVLVDVKPEPEQVQDTNSDMWIAGNEVWGEYLEGLMDEVRTSSVARSEAWVATEYANQYDPESFYSIGPQLSLISEVNTTLIDIKAPIIEDYGVEDSGTGIGKYWAELTDIESNIESVEIKINDTIYSMTNNGTHWTFQLSAIYNAYYEYQIFNATDVWGNRLDFPSDINSSKFNYDISPPIVEQWEYYSAIGPYGTFKANVSDSWGILDKVMVNVTEVAGVPRNDILAIMVLTTSGYMNDTINMEPGTIKFVIIANDTVGNVFISTEHQGLVGGTNNPPIITNIDFSRSGSQLLLPVYSDSILYLNYTYSDPDGDPEDLGGTEIRWYKSGVHQATYDNQKQVPASALVKGEQWNATIKPKDDKGLFGQLYASSIIIIQNSPPTATGVILTPGTPVTTSTLSVGYVYSDPDGDAQNSGNREIHWYKNSVLQVNLNNSLTISSGNTTKAEQWYFQIRVHDGTNYSNWFTSNSVTIANSAPSASNLQITPSTPKTTESLIASYTFIDVDEDSEVVSYIRWYKNGVLQSTLTNLTVVDSSYTNKGESWYFTILPFDGSNYGTLKTSGSISIINSAPSAINLNITPIISTTKDTLTANYTFIDDDMDDETGTEIIWYKYGVLQGALNGSITVSDLYTSKGEVWHFKVHPSDGSIYGSWIGCPTNITIINTAPEVNNLYITPGTPKTGDVLIVNYDYLDNDSDAESGSYIIWYKNGVIQEALNDSNTVNSIYTTKGEVWHFKIRPFDGTSFGNWVGSLNVTIENTAPSASTLTINPTVPRTHHDLYANYTYSDADNDFESDSFIRWYKNSVLQSIYDNITILPYSVTTKGESWYFTILPFDGHEFGSLQQSGTISIGNTAPTALNLNITPNFPFSNDSLTAEYTFMDNDSDSESGTDIIWYKDGVLQGALNGSNTVDSIYIKKGETWSFQVQPSDGIEYGPWIKCPINVTIGNIIPIASNLVINPLIPKSSDALIATYLYSDGDNDPQAGIEVRWYLNGTFKPDLNNTIIVQSGNTTRGETWAFELRVFDGTNYSSWVISYDFTIVNTPPEVSQVKINGNSVSAQVDNDIDLNVSYIYLDFDGDIQDNASREILWYKGGILQGNFNNSLTVGSENTDIGQIWYVTIRVYDGKNYSSSESSASVSIGQPPNQVPVALFLNITPSNPTTNNNLFINWTFYDPDPSDIETGSIYRWYRNGVYMSQYDGWQTLPSSATTKGDVWHVKVRPRDGKDFGLWVGVLMNITIVNTAPTATNLLITPSTPKTGANLYANYLFMDIDPLDIDIGTAIIWYRNDLLQGNLNGTFVVPASNTAKGDIWHFKVRPSDGTDFGNWISCPNNITIINTAPTVSNVAIKPTGAKTGNVLTANYSYFDVDADLENGSLIRWYKNGILQAQLNNSFSIASSFTAKGDLWYFTIQPMDGEILGILRTSPGINILNTAPTAINLTISPINPFTTQVLSSNYYWIDPDNATDSNSGSQIVWYKNGVLQGMLNNSPTVGYSYTTRGDIWHFKVRPKDGVDFGSWVSCLINITILNSIPSVSNLVITPATPSTLTNLIASYIYADVDLDSQTGTEILWYRNGILMGGLNGSLTILAFNTLKGEEWHFKVRPSDGIDFGLWVSCPMNVTIGNTAPTATNLLLTPLSPITGDNIIANYTFLDIDSDIDNHSTVYWYKNGLLQVSLNDSLFIDSYLTSKGENWYFTVQPFDGTDYGIVKKSITITIGNTAPTVYNLQFNPGSPTAASSLVITYSYDDVDSDSQSGTEIRWYRNGLYQATYDDGLTVDSSVLKKGDQWNASIRVSDGSTYSSWVSQIVIIGNSKPVVVDFSAQIYLPPTGLYTTNTLLAAWEESDLDGDAITIYQIRWYKDGVLQGGLNDSDTVNAAYTTKHEEWRFRVRIFDGTDWSDWSIDAIRTIANAEPLVENLTLSGGQTTSSDILLSYNFYDADGDSEISKVDWKIVHFGGSLTTITQYSTTSLAILPSSAYNAGDLIWVVITPDDNDPGTGLITGQLVDSSTTAIMIQVGNTAPQINTTLGFPTIHADHPNGSTLYTSIYPLYINYSALVYDIDEMGGADIFGIDSIINQGVHYATVSIIVGSQYRWYKFNPSSGNYDLQSHLTTPTVDPYYLHRDEQWKASVRPRDSYGYFGAWVNSSPIIIGNSYPQVIGFQWQTANPTTLDSLSFTFNYFDFDDDLLILSNSLILWYKNGALIPANTNKTVLPNSYTQKGDQIFVVFRPYDGTDWAGRNYTSVEFVGMLIILNTPPLAVNITLTPVSPFTTNDLYLNWIFTDLDGDLEVPQYKIIWIKSGIAVPELENQTLVPASATNKGETWLARIWVFDGTNYSRECFSNDGIVITIQNSLMTIPSVDFVGMTTNTTFKNATLTATWSILDPDNDGQVNYRVSWYISSNGINYTFRGDFGNKSLTILSSELWKGDSWYFVVQVFDGQEWSANATSSILTIINAPPQVINCQYEFDSTTSQVEPDIRSNTAFQFYVEDENLSIILSYFDLDGDLAQNRIQWYKKAANQTSWSEMTSYENLSMIPYVVTTVGDTWYCMITPFDGVDYGNQLFSPLILIESRPVIHSYRIDPDETRDGAFEFTTEITNARDPIDRAEFDYFFFDNTSQNQIASYEGNNTWTVFFTITDYQFLNTELRVQVKAITKVSTSEFTIFSIFSFNINITDQAPPRVQDAWFEKNLDKNPTNLTFKANIEEYGSGIAEVILFYYFEPVSNGGTGAWWLQEDLVWQNATMSFYSQNQTGIYTYSVTVPFNPNKQDMVILYKLSTRDNAGQYNPVAFDIRNDPQYKEQNQIPYQEVGLPSWILLVLGLIVSITFIGSIVYVKFIRKPELIGLDKDLVLDNIKKITEDQNMESMDAHTVGIVISFFDQRHGPIPIIVIPELLRDNFTKLVELSDRSFSGTGFSNDFDMEIPSSYDFVLTQGLRLSIYSFGFALERPEARGGQENLTLNILIHSEVFPLVNQFQNEIKMKVHEIHLMMDTQNTKDRKEEIISKVLELRKYCTSIILSYEQLYGTTELIDE